MNTTTSGEGKKKPKLFKLEIIGSQASLIRFCVRMCLENGVYYGNPDSFERNAKIVIRQIRRQQIKAKS